MPDRMGRICWGSFALCGSFACVIFDTRSMNSRGYALAWPLHYGLASGAIQRHIHLT